MKTIALIHTVLPVANSFEAKLRAGVSKEIAVHHLLDTYLASNANQLGIFTIKNRERLFLDIKAQEMTGADLIVTTCSTLTPIVDMIRPFVKTPIIAIDDAMAIKGVTYGSKIFILATAESTIQPTKMKLLAQAKNANVEIEIETYTCHDAYTAVKELRIEEHNKILAEKAKTISGYDCIILAQASMADMEEEISMICGCPVLSSPKLCIEQIDIMLKNL